MTINNLEIWNKLQETPIKHTKGFKRPGGFSGTSINPTFTIKRMTEIFGPCGSGWGIEKPEYEFIHTTKGEVLIYCTATVWYKQGDDRHQVYGVGGDLAVNDTKSGLKADDEAAKKAFTDAVGNALKHIGNAADLHLGMYDDNKYVNDLKEKSNQDPAAETKKKIVSMVRGYESAKTYEELTEMVRKNADFMSTLSTEQQKFVNDKLTPIQTQLSQSPHQDVVDAVNEVNEAAE